MKVVVLANRRWQCHSPSWYRLLDDSILVSLVYDRQWFLTDGQTWVPVPDRDTGAMLLAKELNRIAANGAGQPA